MRTSHHTAFKPDDDGAAWFASLDRPGRDIALVIAEGLTRDLVVELYRARGYDVVTPETPLAVIQALLAHRDRIGCTVVSPDAAWATGFSEFLADEYAEIDHVVLVANGAGSSAGAGALAR